MALKVELKPHERVIIGTAVITNGKIHLQAGGGVVADSDPEAEYQESMNKLEALVRAVELATEGLA